MKTFAFFLALIVTACTVPQEWREVTADRIAAPAFMVDRLIPAPPFRLQAYERMHYRDEAATIYIEGTPHVFATPQGVKKGENIWFDDNSATPALPTALHLASRDKSRNLAHIAWPCQYQGFEGNKKGDDSCTPEYWNQAKYSDTVINAYSTALDNIRAMYGITQFDLIGHGDGGGIAVILAAQREDVRSFRTVAANLDHSITQAVHGMPAVLGGHNPVDFAAQTSTIPQHHFLGGKDIEIIPSVYQSYRTALGSSDCVQSTYVYEAAHHDGWIDLWPELLKLPVECEGPMVMDDDPVPYPNANAPQEFFDVKKGSKRPKSGPYFGPMPEAPAPNPSEATAAPTPVVPSDAVAPNGLPVVIQ